MKGLRWFAPILMFAGLQMPLWAKGPTTRIVLQAPASSPIEVTDAALLDQFVVWSGPGVTMGGHEQSEGFIVDWMAGPVTAHPERLPRYDVSFYVKHASPRLAAEPEHLAYVVSYEPDPTGGRGYVYLPGTGDARYALNTRTIFRDREGQWFRASDAWDRAARIAIARRR
jgi:hypothetical protein